LFLTLSFWSNQEVSLLDSCRAHSTPVTQAFITIDLSNFLKKNHNALLFFFIHLFPCAYIVWAISPLYPPSIPQSPSLPGRTCSALISNFVEEKT
jgi:hypothetical protein